MKNTNVKYLFWILLFIILSMFLQCCRYTNKFFYNHLDYILYHDLNKYFKPDEKQRDLLKKKLAELLQWNRDTALVRYKDIFVYIKNALGKGITAENISYVYRKFDSEIEKIADKVAPDAAEFVLTLNNKQLKNFQEESKRRRIKEEKRRAGDPDDPLERRTRSSIRFLSRFYGSFSSEQSGKIKEFIRKSDYPQYDWWEYRDIKHREFVELLNNEPGKETVTVYLANWLGRKYNSASDSYRDKVLAERKFNTELFIYTDRNIVTGEQRMKVLDTIDGWIATIDELLNSDN